MRKYIPNALTILRIALIPALVGLYFVEPRTWWSIVLYFFICISDFFDGYLARRWDVQSPVGAFLDPVADKLLVTTVLLILCVDYQHWAITLPAIVIIAREVTMSALREWMAKQNLSDIVAVDALGKYKTTAQMFALAFLLAPAKSVYFAIGISLLYVATILTVISLVRYTYKASLTFNAKTIIHHTN